MTGKRILVVEDQEDLRGVLRDLLTVTRLPKLRTAKPVCPKLAPSTPTSSSWTSSYR
jgi:hypothetical protein